MHWGGESAVGVQSDGMVAAVLTQLLCCAEYMDGGELAARCTPLQPFSEFDAARIARQVLSALAHLHSLRICHTDIKPENILFASRSGPQPMRR